MGTMRPVVQICKITNKALIIRMINAFFNFCKKTKNLQVSLVGKPEGFYLSLWIIRFYRVCLTSISVKVSSMSPC